MLEGEVTSGKINFNKGPSGLFFPFIYLFFLVMLILE